MTVSLRNARLDAVLLLLIAIVGGYIVPESLGTVANDTSTSNLELGFPGSFYWNTWGLLSLVGIFLVGLMGLVAVIILPVSLFRPQFQCPLPLRAMAIILASVLILLLALAGPARHARAVAMYNYELPLVNNDEDDSSTHRPASSSELLK